ncbi:MAG: hypothetical protein ABI240_07705 [Sphingomonas sp.]
MIFLDETDVTTNMVRRYGRGPRDKRVRGYWKAAVLSVQVAAADRGWNYGMLHGILEKGTVKAMWQRWRCGDIQPG